jgi:hypothetical protein
MIFRKLSILVLSSCVLFSACGKKESLVDDDVVKHLQQKIESEMEKNHRLEKQIADIGYNKIKNGSKSPEEILNYLSWKFWDYLPKEIGVKRNFYITKAHFYENNFIALDLTNDTLDRRLLLSRLSEDRLTFKTIAVYERLLEDDWSVISGTDSDLGKMILSYGVTNSGNWKEVASNIDELEKFHTYYNQWFNFSLTMPKSWYYWGQGETDGSLFRVLLGEEQVDSDKFSIVVDVVSTEQNETAIGGPVILENDGKLEAIKKINDEHSLKIQGNVSDHDVLLDIIEKISTL